MNEVSLSDTFTFIFKSHWNFDDSPVLDWMIMDRIKLSTKNVSIEFPGVKALENINFEVSTGEIRAVVGANGAGKSTLMKVLSGANPTYTGEVLLNDKECYNSYKEQWRKRYTDFSSDKIVEKRKSALEN